MNTISLHGDFTPQGCAARQPPQPAVTLGPGVIWMHAYNTVTTKGGRYVQGGGCGTVGVAGLVQGGGFGTYSKQFGTAGASLLEAEIVTAGWGGRRAAHPCGLKSSCKEIAFMRRVQISRESGAFDLPR